MTNDPGEKIRSLCLQIMDVAESQGWDWELSARPHGKEGWSITVYKGKPKATQLTIESEAAS